MFQNENEKKALLHESTKITPKTNSTSKHITTEQIINYFKLARLKKKS